MAVTTINKGKRFGKLLEGYIDTRLLKSRHEELVADFERRDYTHRSPLPEFEDPELGFVFSEAENLAELARRCETCRELQNAQ